MLRKTRVPYTEKLDGLFYPLSLADNRAHELTREKARNWDRAQHPSEMPSTFTEDAKLGVSPQYVSRILSGNTNFSFKSVADIEGKLGISCMKFAMA